MPRFELSSTLICTYHVLLITCALEVHARKCKTVVLGGRSIIKEGITSKQASRWDNLKPLDAECPPFLFNQLRKDKEKRECRKHES